MPRSLGEIIPRKNATPGIGQALATGVKKAAGKVVFGGAPLPLTDRAFVDPDRTIEELSWGFPDVALWRGISAIPPVKEALQRPEMGREVVKSLIPRPFRPFIKVGDVPPEIQETLVDFGGIMLTGLGRGLLTPAVKSLSPQGVTSGATKRVGGVLQKSPRWNKFLDDFQKLVVEKTGKSVSREEIHNSFIRTIHKEFSKLPYLKRLNRMLGEAGLVKIGKYKISEQALENLKIMLDQGTAPGAAISTVSKGEKWGADVLKKAYKKYFKEDFPQEKPEKLPELIKGKMSEKKFKDAMLKAATEEELLNIADEADDWATNKLTKKRLRGFARRVLDRLKATPPDIGVEAPLSMEEVFKDAVGKGKAVDTDIYKLNMNNIGKEIPPNFDKTAIPAIEKATKNVKGDVIKNKIYNYLVYYYNKGITEGVMDTLNIYAQGKTKQVYYKIDKDGVSIKLVPKGKPGKIESAEEVRARIKKEVAPKAETPKEGAALLAEARKYKSAEEFVGAIKKKDIYGQLQKKLSNVGFSEIESAVDTISGARARQFRTKDGNIVQLNMGTDNTQIFISNLNIAKKGTGLGAKIVSALKEIATETGKRISVMDASAGFWRKQGFDKYGDWESGEFDTRRKQLTDIWNKAQGDDLAGMVEEAPPKPEAKPRQKVKLKKRPATTAWGWVLEQGGIKPSSLEALGYNLGEWRQAGLWGLLRKDGRALDELAQEATKREGDGWLEVPSTMNPSDRLVKALQDRERTVSESEEAAIKEYKRQEREAAKEAKAAQKKLSKEEQKKQALEDLADDLTAISQALSQENASTAYDSLEAMTERLEEVRDKEQRKILSEFINRHKLKVVIDSLVERGVIRDEDLPALFEEGYEETEDFIRELTRGARFIRFKNELKEAYKGLPKEVSQRLNDSSQAAFRVKMKELQSEYGGGPEGDINPFLSMRYYLQSIETQAGEMADGFYEFWEENLIEPTERTEEVIRQYEGRLRKIPGFANMASDDKVLARIAAYISSQSRLQGIPPIKLKDNELKLAQEIQSILKEFEWRARLAKVEDWYHKGGDPPPDAPESDLKEAKKVLELKGREALIEYLKTKDWGIIAQGYEPLSVAKPAILHKVSPYGFGKGHIQSRSMIDYEAQERNILIRLNSYMRQILNLNEIEPAVMYFSGWLDEFSHALQDPKSVGKYLGKEIEAIKGYYSRGGPLERYAKRVYSHASTALILPDPKKWTRNKFQNSAFYPHPQDLVNPNNHVLNKERMDYVKTYVLQTRPFFEHYLMSGEKPFFGLGKLVRWARQLSLYPWTDETNRIECFWAKINALDRAYNSYIDHNDLNRFITEANFIDIEPLQQKRALNLLFRQGPEAMKRYIAKEVTYNVHFPYDWKLRSPAELSDRVLANLFAFVRGYGERAVKEISKINNNKLSVQERWAALRITMRLLFGAVLTGGIFMKITGAHRNPYAPWNIIQWTPGGLLLGSLLEIESTVGNIKGALSGRKGALDGAIRSITGCSDMFVPFYSMAMDMLEAASDMRNIDRRALRKMRGAVDKRYRVQERSYKIKRTVLEKWQHALFGTKQAEKRVEDKRTRKRPGLVQKAWKAISKKQKQKPKLSDLIKRRR